MTTMTTPAKIFLIVAISLTNQFSGGEAVRWNDGLGIA